MDEGGRETADRERREKTPKEATALREQNFASISQCKFSRVGFCASFTPPKLVRLRFYVSFDILLLVEVPGIGRKLPEHVSTSIVQSHPAMACVCRLAFHFLGIIVWFFCVSGSWSGEMLICSAVRCRSTAGLTPFVSPKF